MKLLINGIWLFMAYFEIKSFIETKNKFLLFNGIMCLLLGIINIYFVLK